MDDYISVIEIEKEISKLNNSQIYDLMWSALGYMQQYNGRAKFDCICMSLGYEVIEMNNGPKKYKWA